jgi:putative ABC transport system permease protein
LKLDSYLAFLGKTMVLFRIAFRNLGRGGRKNIALSVLIAVGIGAFFTGNAVLQSSVGGIHRTFSDNFTADLSVSQRSDQSFSIFGPDIPIIGDYESVPLLVNAADVGVRVASLPGVAGMAYVLTSPILVEVGGVRQGGLGLGVIGDEYFTLFPTPRFIQGAPPAPGSSGWAVITEEWANKIAAAQGRPPSAGDKLQLSFFHDDTFSIREATLAGIIRYSPSNEALKSAVIMDARILRALCGYSDGGDVPAQPGAQAIVAPETGTNLDIDSLFSDAKTPARGAASPSFVPVSIQELQTLMSSARHDGAVTNPSPLGHSGAWSFVLIRAAKGADRNLLETSARDMFGKAKLAVQVRDWRGTAGAVALYVRILQIAMYVGLGMLAGIVLILTTNSLVMSVFERTSEIGTMRAMGAQSGFIRGLFIVETGSLSLIAGTAGVLMGSAVILLMTLVPLRLHNQILVLLFGGTSITPTISGTNVAISIIASLILGSFAWAYPVRLALRISPVRAANTSS